jgi:cysteine dioxygenase
MISECSIQEFIRQLRSLGKSQFTLEGVHQFLKNHPINPGSLEDYLFFRKSHYTRNLIDKCHLYEVLSLCWEPGHKSQIHNHRGQNCWMAVPLGKLLVQNYRIVGGADGTEHCELAESSQYWMDALNPGKVEPQEPIHSVANPAELNQRAVSVHVYSLPYDACTVYFPEQRRSLEVPLHYSSKYGILELEEQQD